MVVLGRGCTRRLLAELRGCWLVRRVDGKLCIEVHPNVIVEVLETLDVVEAPECDSLGGAGLSTDATVG